MTKKKKTAKKKREKELDFKKLPFAVWIPGYVHFSDIKGTDIKVYGYVSSLANAKGYCYASNEYIAGIFNISERTVSRSISGLVEKGFLRHVIVRDKLTKMTVGRRLYITVPKPEDDESWIPEEDVIENTEEIEVETGNKNDDSEVIVKNEEEKSASNVVIPTAESDLDNSYKPTDSGIDKNDYTYRQKCLGNNISINNINIINRDLIDNDCLDGDKTGKSEIEKTESINKNKSTIVYDLRDKEIKTRKTKPKNQVVKKVINENTPYYRIMKKFNEFKETSYKYQTKEFIENIDELMKIYTEEEILDVVDYVQKDNYNPKYYRPSTVFRLKVFNGNFEWMEKKKKTCDIPKSQVFSKQQFYFYYNVNVNEIVKNTTPPSNPETAYFLTEEEATEHALKNNLIK